MGDKIMKIMFICTGNICRSAMAEGMLKQKLKQNNIKNIEVYSCGIYAETGDYATYNSIEVAKDYGADIKNHKATNIRDSRINEMDIILCATNSHKQNILYMYPNLKDKVYTMKEYAKIDQNGQDLNIKDPWGYDINIYYNCAKEINDCLEKIIERIKEEN